MTSDPAPDEDPGRAAASPTDAMAARVDALHAVALELVETRSDGGNGDVDPLRGLYLTSEEALRQGDRDRSQAGSRVEDYLSVVISTSVRDRLDVLERRSGLGLLDVHILMAALAPDVDRRFEPLYGFLNDDVGRRRATVSLALELVGLEPRDPRFRARFHRRAPLRADGLLVVADRERGFPSRELRPADRLVDHLLGDDGLDEELAARAVRCPPEDEVSGPDQRATTFGARIARLLAAGYSTVYVKDRRGIEASGVADVVTGEGMFVLRVELPVDTDAALALVPALLLEARLTDAVVVAGPLPPDAGRVVRAIEVGEVPVVLVDRRAFDPAWSFIGRVVPLDPPPDRRTPSRVWSDELGADASDLDVETAVGAFRLGPGQARRAARIARAYAVGEDGPVGPEHLRRAARWQSAPMLDQHARRVDPAVGWDDVVLPAEPRAQLDELVLRARRRHRVLGDWRLRVGGARGHGVTSLFAGDSGTGKTLAAEAVAGELGIALYVVDLSAIVDKYIGETEKNLDKLFTEADRTDAVLLFDEADAVFGKRSEVKDARDRHANTESAFLLQRLEAFDGIAVLTTNLRANIDEAFTRRLDLVVDFPFPDATLRTRLWRQSLAHAPCDPALNLGGVGSAYELSGGAIRSAAVTAAYLAAGRGGTVTEADVVTGARREYVKSGRVVW